MAGSSVEQGLAAALLAADALTTLVGQGVFPNKAPQGWGYPYVTYKRLGTDPVYVMTGRAGEGQVRLEVSCYATTYSAAKDIAAAVRGAIDAFAGTLNGQQLQALGTFMDDEEDDYIPPQHADDTGVHQVRFTVSLWAS